MVYTISKHVHKSHKRDVEQKKPDTEEHILYDSIYILKVLRQAKLIYAVTGQDSSEL